QAFGFVMTCVVGLGLLSPCGMLAFPAGNVSVLTKAFKSEDSIDLAGGGSEAVLVVDEQDFPVVHLAANLFADDVQRVTGHHLAVTNFVATSPQLIVVGTIGKSAIIQKLIATGKLKDADKVQNRWEGTLTEVISQPFPGVERALVIVGS